MTASPRVNGATVPATVHVIGAGMAGLAAAVRLAGSGRRVVVHEAAPQAGGRCRSFHDRTLGCSIDNGNHLLLSANRAVLGYLAEIGAGDRLTGPAEAAFPFVDLASGERWTVRPNRGPLPWWVFRPDRRIPGTRPRDYLGGLRLMLAGAEATVGDCIAPDDPLYRPFWEPLTLAVMNLPPAQAAARPLRTVLARTFARGAAQCRPLIARDGLGPDLVAPAVEFLTRHGAELRLGRRLRAIGFRERRAAELDFDGERLDLGPDDRVVVAVPPGGAAMLLPGLTVPAEGEPIVNAHFLLDREIAALTEIPFLGVLGGTAHWLFRRGAVVSVTVSGAAGLVEEPAELLAARLWADTARALALAGEEPAGGAVAAGEGSLDPARLPACRIIKERRATFTQSPANIRHRPLARTAWANVVLAGDWTATGLPATIESAVASGQAAARALGA